MTAAAPRILLVEDDRVAREGLSQLLQRAGFEVVAVGTFAEGRAALRDENPDFLIADVRLGEFNGLQLLTLSPRHLPAVIVTGFADRVLEAEARRLGAEFVVKPISPPDLVALVRTKLAARGPDRPPRRWVRKAVHGVDATIDNRAARIVDISYGGVRFELDHAVEPAATSLTLSVAEAGITVPVDVVWVDRSNQARCVYGAVVRPGAQGSQPWHGFVDRMS